MRSNPMRATSPWPSLLNQSIQLLQTAIARLGPPTNRRGFTNALDYAERLLYRAWEEVRRVMSGRRQTAVLNELSHAVIRINAARSALEGISLIPPEDSLWGAINHIRNAQSAVGLRAIGR